jgi:hypothetical protein
MDLRVLRCAIVLLVLLVSGCGDYCSQDDWPPTYIDTTVSPYHLAYRTTNTDLERVTWLNRTTSEAGDASVEGPYYELIWPLGYFWVMRVSMDIPLVAGANDIRVMEYDRGSSCGFYDDYVITYFP